MEAVTMREASTTQQFVYDNEPADPEQAATFRAALHKMLNEHRLEAVQNTQRHAHSNYAINMARKAPPDTVAYLVTGDPDEPDAKLQKITFATFRWAGCDAQLLLGVDD
jgi:hypothetical protein